jgi:hypothetical protein
MVRCGTKTCDIQPVLFHSKRFTRLEVFTGSDICILCPLAALDDMTILKLLKTLKTLKNKELRTLKFEFEDFDD